MPRNWRDSCKIKQTNYKRRIIYLLYTYVHNLYGNFKGLHLTKKSAMRKIYFVLVVSFVLVSVSTNAQSEKKEPPPPPPKMESTKFTPPKIVKSEEKHSKENPPVIVDKKVNASKSKEPPVITVRGKLADDFYTRNPSVESISRQEDIISLKMKDGTTEKYDMSKKEEDKIFTDKYGRSPIPPPPPPPPAKQKVKA